MQAVFYSFSKRKNSTAAPSDGGRVYEITLKNGCSYLRPVFVISDNDFNYNYCSFNGRYYWVTDINAARNGMFEVSCVVDVLASWKDDILNTSAMIEYSASDYDLMISDRRLAIKNTSQRVFNFTVIHPKFTTRGSFLLGVINNIGGSAVKQGFTTIYQVDAGMLSEIADKFATAECLEGLLQEFTNPMDAIVFCRWCPMETGLSVFEGPVLIGTYDTGLTADILATRYLAVDVDVNIPWQTNDFTSVEPFTEGALYLPGVGVVPLSLSSIRSLSSLRVRVVIDTVSDGIFYSVSGSPGSFQYGNYIASYSGVINQSLPVASIQSDWTGILTGLADMGTSIATGNIPGTLGGLAESTLAAMKSSPKGSGGFSSGGSIDLGTEICIILTKHDTPMMPDDYRSLIGNACFKTRTIQGIVGYCKTNGFQVGGTMTETEKTQINGLLDGGVYIE